MVSKSKTSSASAALASVAAAACAGGAWVNASSKVGYASNSGLPARNSRNSRRSDMIVPRLLPVHLGCFARLAAQDLLAAPAVDVYVGGRSGRCGARGPPLEILGPQPDALKPHHRHRLIAREMEHRGRQRRKVAQAVAIAVAFDDVPLANVVAVTRGALRAVAVPGDMFGAQAGKVLRLEPVDDVVDRIGFARLAAGVDRGIPILQRTRHVVVEIEYHATPFCRDRALGLLERGERRALRRHFESLAIEVDDLAAKRAVRAIEHAIEPD